MYYVGIDVSKYKHDCYILDQSGETIANDFIFANNLLLRYFKIKNNRLYLVNNTILFHRHISISIV